MDAVAFPPPPAPFPDDDFEFGDFTFASAAPTQPPLPNPDTAPFAAFDDDWGDFVASPLGSNPDPSPPAWEKPRGPLPLSLFGADKEEAGEKGSPEPPPTATAHQCAPSTSALVSPHVDLKDLIANMYGSQPPSTPAAEEDGDGFGDDGWEFKAAPDSATIPEGGDRTHGDGVQDVPKTFGNGHRDWSVLTTLSDNLSHVQTIYCNGTHESVEQNIKDSSSSPSNKVAILNLYKQSEQVDCDQITENPAECAQGSLDLFSNNKMNSSFETDENHSIKSTGKSILIDFYHSLREGCFAAISRHLKDLMEAQKTSVLSDLKGDATTIEKEIQNLNTLSSLSNCWQNFNIMISLVALEPAEDSTFFFPNTKEICEKLQISLLPEDFSIEEHPSRDVCLDGLSKSTKEECLKDFEREYHLSQKITLAVEDMSSAIELYRHSVSTLHILQLASKEEQYGYIGAWYSIVLSCAQELQHGAVLWQESCGASVCDQVISQGGHYFLALGEIYRVVQILNFSLKCFKPWVLADPGMWSKMLACLDDCRNAWATSLEIALKRVADTDHADASIAKALLEFIKNINELDVPSLQNVLPNNKMVCKLTLVPTTLFPGMEVIVWNGDCYFVKVANFWANQIYCDPPQLTRTPVAWPNNGSMPC